MAVRLRWSKVVLFLAGLGPVALLGWRGWNQFHGAEPDLGVNPIEFITHSTGDWTLIFLMVTLAVTPARRLLRLPGLIQYRRMVGLFAFFYGVLHFLTFAWLDKFFDLREMLADVAKRPFITAGFAALVLMLPLAVTSTTGWIRRLGGKRWQWLHRLDLSALAGVIHYWWLVKSDIRKPALFAAILALLMLYRIVTWSVPALRARFAAAPAVTAKTAE
jgi:methionine sulfoxide reductase heme-binding subunit